MSIHPRVATPRTSLASHTPSQREEGSGHAATIELSPRQKLVRTNQIRALRRSHRRCHGVQLRHNVFSGRMSAAYYLTAMVNNCVPRRQLGSCSVTRPFLSLRRGVACETNPEQGVATRDSYRTSNMSKRV